MENNVQNAPSAIGPGPVTRQYNSEGERRVRAAFNPSALDAISNIKRKGIELINEVDSMGPLSHWGPAEIAEFGRCKATSITQIELGTMMAVKAATVGL